MTDPTGPKVTIHRDGTWSADGGPRRAFWRASGGGYQTTVGDRFVISYWRRDFAPKISRALRQDSAAPKPGDANG